MNITAPVAIRKMWSIADKPERMRCLHKIVFELGIRNATLFWSEFWNVWQSSENLHEDIDYFPDLIDHGLGLGSPHTGLEDDERSAIASLPEVITVYRGAVDFNQRGWSWTTDRDKAKWFAGRSFGSKNRVVLTGRVNKPEVLAYLSGRGESEIVVNPDNVIDVTIDEQWEAENEGSALFYAAQSGKLDSMFGGTERMDKVRAEMTVANMEPTDERIAELEEVLLFCEWANLGSKRGLIRETLKLLRRKKADPSSVPTMTGYQL